MDLLPPLDEKVETILKGLAEGKTRDQLAIEFGNRNWKSVDMYMRRRNYSWDSEKQTYFYLTDNAYPQMKDNSKASKIIYHLDQGSMDPKEIAIRFGFKDHRDMAEYMGAKGYKWDGNRNNYIKQVGWIDSYSNGDTNSMPPTPQLVGDDYSYATFHNYLPLLQLLDKNKDKLVELLQPIENAKIPRYLVPGVARTKTIQMMNTLHDMIADYCNEHNINQRALFEVALIEFFMKYGYKKEVEILMKR